MWHEARKQEKKIRGMIVDYRKRADRRKEFYERIVSLVEFPMNFFHFCQQQQIKTQKLFEFLFRQQRADPTQFLQLHGRKYKINFDVADLTDESHMWEVESD